MSEFRLNLMCRVVLIPMWIAYLVAAGVYLLKSRWLIGAFLVLMDVVVWLLWKWVKWRIVTEAYVGPQAEAEQESEDDDHLPKSPYPMSGEEAQIISRTMSVIGYILGATTIMLSIHYGMRAYLAIPLGIAALWLGSSIVGKAFVALCVMFEVDIAKSDEESG